MNPMDFIKISMEFLGNPMEFLKVSLDLNGFAKEYNGLLKDFMNTHWDFHDCQGMF